MRKEEARNKTARMKELTTILNQAAAVYYQGQDEIMSNFEYDKLYDELQTLEKETGIVLAGSPTDRVGYEVLSELPKEAHPSPMLSLDKTKDVEQLSSWLGSHSQEGLLSWKMDGLTIVLTYVAGSLHKAVTRGNGRVGEVITNNAKVFQNVPLSIPFQGELVLRGEAVISYSEFNRINQSLDMTTIMKRIMITTTTMTTDMITTTKVMTMVPETRLFSNLNEPSSLE